MTRRNKIIAKAPARISFAGGGTDLPEYFRKYRGMVLSGTIDKYIKVEITQKADMKDGIFINLKNFNRKEFIPKNEITSLKKDHFDLVRGALSMANLYSRMEITIDSDIPSGSGLGSSSATAVALLGGLFIYQGKKFTRTVLAENAVKLERDILGLTCGWQDQYASSFGGLNIFKFSKNGQVDRFPLKLSQKTGKQLEKNLLLYFLGTTRSSYNKQSYLVENMQYSIAALKKLGELKLICKKIVQKLLEGDLNGFAESLDLSWQAKKMTSPVITNTEINLIYSRALQNGALGGKLLGAGGGGVLLLYCPFEKRQKLIENIIPMGGKIIPFKFESKGFHYES